MSLYLDREIAKLKQNLLALCTTVEERVDTAVRALEARDARLARAVIQGDDAVDVAEVDVEEECLKTLALYQPVAGDLRLIIAFLKINNDLERIGDLAVHIAERALDYAERPGLAMPFNFRDMAAKVRAMLKRSIDSVVNLDATIALQVLKADDEVDEMHRTMYNAVTRAAGDRPQELPALLDALSVSRYLERIADHATNIAEDAIYMLEGDIIRHRGGRPAAAAAATTTPKPGRAP
ncbi:MAG: phosphate signaling complex protein PhoU [Lentisphaeria bacterium]|jgi:phosphate transport system protein